MEFMRDDRLPGLKLFLREDTEERKRWYVFEEDFADEKYWGESARKIVACITIFYKEKRLDFHVNDFLNDGVCNSSYRGKGYETRIMYYMESELLPKYPDFEITINNHQEYLNFKNHVEEKIRESLNVLVIGEDESLIQNLKVRGYKKIYNIKSYVAAITFLEEHIDIASHIHLVLLRRFSDEDVHSEIREHLNAVFSYQPEEFNSYLITPLKKEKVHFHFWENEIPRIFFYDKSFLEEDRIDKVKYYSIVTYDWIESNYSLYISYVEKQLFPLLQVSHLKREELPISLPASKENKVKKLEDLRILFLTRGDNYTYFREYFAKKGISHVTMFEDNNYSYVRHALNQLGDYDIITAPDMHSYSLLFNYLEAKAQGNLCGRETKLLACYNASSIYEGVTMENDVDYRLMDKEEVIRKDYFFRMLYDDANPDETHKDFEYIYVRIMETIIREYLDYINSKGVLIPCEQFSSYLELQAACEKETQKREEFYSVFDTLLKDSCAYLRVKEKYRIRKIEEVSITDKNDYIRICFYLNGICKGAVNIPKRVQTKGRIFSIEMLGKNGGLLPPKKVNLLYPGDKGDASIPTLNENELRLLQGISKRVKTYVIPLLEEPGVKKKFVPGKR